MLCFKFKKKNSLFIHGYSLLYEKTLQLELQNRIKRIILLCLSLDQITPKKEKLSESLRQLFEQL